MVNFAILTGSVTFLCVVALTSAKLNCFHREKSNLALTLCNEKNEVIAHAAFLDYPNWNITDQSDWESFLHENYINTKCTVSKLCDFS